MTSVVKKDDAVSPVIGTILLVAITVVLVAIVAAVVMGMAGGVQSSKDVGATVQPFANVTGTPSHGVNVIIYGGKDANKLTTLNVTVDNVDLKVIGASNAGVEDPQVGSPYAFVITETPGSVLANKLVVVRGNFTDGSTSVLVQSTVTIPAATTT